MLQCLPLLSRVHFCLAGVLAAVFALSPANAAVVCIDKKYRGVSPTGPIPYINKQGAELAARGAWEAIVVTAGYKSYAVWSMARSKKTTCNQYPNGIGGYNHTCTLEGRPCRNE